MSIKQPSEALTSHALLVAWGIYARQLGLIEGMMGIALKQQTYRHRPQTKVLEFLVAMLAGLRHLQEISRAAQPLDQDTAVAEAWQQPGWADYSGVSRTLQALRQSEAEAIVAVLAQISQPLLAAEIHLALQQSGSLLYDLDLTGRPVSNSSETYPGAAFGYMSDGLFLGYQAALISLQSPTYGRLWLAVTPHPGDTVSCNELRHMVQTAEQSSGLRPLRRTDLLAGRIQHMQQQVVMAAARWQSSQRQLGEAVQSSQALSQLVEEWRERVTDYEQLAAQRKRTTRPFGRLAVARQRLAGYEQRLKRWQQKIAQAEQLCQKRQRIWQQLHEMLTSLTQHLDQCQADNVQNQHPIRAVVRMDAGFGTCENVDWLIEMGYDLYTKPYSHEAIRTLHKQVNAESAWQRVDDNAEMIAWDATAVSQYSYPLDVALVRFHTGKTRRHSALLHYGHENVLTDLPAWFRRYNQRQLIEAGIKEGKNVFAMHHLKVRSQPALFLQEHFAVFAANFVRWAAHWLRQANPPAPALNQLPVVLPLHSVKTLVQVAAHTAAVVYWFPDGCLLKFSDQSLYAGSILHLGAWAFQLPLFRSYHFL
jgi:hypothetical protein